MKKNSKQIKKILLTQNALRSIAGSEIVTLELASYFKQNNIDVTVFTWYYSDPIKKEFEKRQINVVTDEFDKNLDKDFDIVWVNHQVLPMTIIKKLNKPPFPYFIFYHMSSLDNLYLEQPYVYNLEKQIGTTSLFVSNEAMLFNKKKYGNIFNNPAPFLNFSPETFLNPSIKPSSSNKILVVSNHPPEEIEKAKTLLKKSNLIVDSIGQKNAKYDLITPDLLKKYRCIISIGKTVQYCLTLNIPIYIYDHFGGCGFLNNENYKKAQDNNFSGRGFNTKKPEQIAKEITNNIDSAILFQTKNLKKFQELFSISNNIHKLISSLPKQRKTIKLSQNYINYVAGAETLAKQKVVAENNLCILEKNSIDRQNELDHLKNLVKIFEEQNIESKNTIKSMEKSRIIKIDKKIRNLLSPIKAIITNNKNQ